MKVRNKILQIILFVICIAFFSTILFAQDISALKADIYPKIGCITCKNMTIDKCNCPQSREMKAYIEALLETGVPREEIFYKVAKKFSLKAIMDRQIQAVIEKRLIEEAGQSRAQIILEPTSFEFGQLSLTQEKVTKVFKIYNRGIADLIITNIKAHCGCTTASLKVDKEKSPYFGTEGVPAGWQATITAGKSADLEVVLDLKHRSIAKGKLFREISIYSNDPLYPETKISIEAEIID